MAIISIAKLFLLICALVSILISKEFQQVNKKVSWAWAPKVIALSVAFLALSLLWTVAPLADGVGSVVKYSKLILIILMMTLIRDEREARFAMIAFMSSQALVMLSSWLLFAHLPVLWATSRTALSHYTVFSGYLDQGIMTAVFAALCWHLRPLLKSGASRLVACFVAAAALLNVVFVLSGRSGHLVAILLLSMGVMWELPKKYRATAVLMPFALVAVLFFTSTQVHDRLLLAKSEITSYSPKQDVQNTSSGVRLDFWRSALTIIADHPATGVGVGSWSAAYDQLQTAKNPSHQPLNSNSNPHQEYLYWGVQLGVPGIFAFMALLISLFVDSAKLATPVARAMQSTLLALAIACLFNSTLYDALIGDFFCITLGLLLALGRQQMLASSPSHLPYEGKTSL